MNMSENLKSKQMQTVITRRGRGLCHGDYVMMGDSFVLRNEGSACQGGVLVQITGAGHHWLALLEAPAKLVSGEGLLPGVQMASFVCPHMWGQTSRLFYKIPDPIHESSTLLT